MGIHGVNYTLDNLQATTLTPDNSSFGMGEGDEGFVLTNVVSKDIRFYGSFFCVIVGLTCNFLTLMVMLSTKLRATSYGMYLSALAIADSLVLINELVKLTDHPRIGWRWTSHSNVTCKLSYHLRYGAQLLSAMLVTSITVERFIVIAFPLKVGAMAMTKIAKRLVAAEFLIASTLGCYGSILFELVQFYPGMTPFCLVRMGKAEMYEECNLYITKVFGEVILPAIVLVFTLLIIKEVMVAARVRKMHLSGTESNDKEKGRGKIGLQKTKKKKTSGSEIQLTIMLLSVAISFILLRIPYTICWYMGHYGLEPKTVFSNAPLNDSTNVTYVLVLANYSINFFLYSLSGGTFRENLKAVLLCDPSRKRGLRRKYTASANNSITMETEIGSMQTLPDVNERPI